MSTSKGRVLWVGDAVVSSGFAVCTHAVCDHLHAAGYEVHILGINHFGDPHPYPYNIYPCIQPFDEGRDLFGLTRLPHLISRLQPDIIVLLTDPWNVAGYMEAVGKSSHTCPVLGWIAVDAKNQRGDQLNALSHLAVWTDFAKTELQAGGYSGPMSICPLGVDTTLFYPRDRSQSRSLILPSGISHDRLHTPFIVGVVGRNQPRKRLDLTLAYFAEWITKHYAPNAYLYLHVAPTGDQGCDIRNLTRYYGLEGRVILASPDIGKGVDGSVLPYLYSAFDLYLTTSQGEGWGLPCLEAMACGVPCIVPDWSGLGSDGGWPGGSDAVYRVPCTSTCLSAPLGSLAYTIGGVMDRACAVAALNLLYHDAEQRAVLSSRGLTLASSLTWRSAVETFESVLHEVMDRERVAA